MEVVVLNYDGFGTNATSFSSVLNHAATHGLIECLGPGSGGRLWIKLENQSFRSGK